MFQLGVANASCIIIDDITSTLRAQLQIKVNKKLRSVKEKASAIPKSLTDSNDPPNLIFGFSLKKKPQKILYSF